MIEAYEGSREEMITDSLINKMSDEDVMQDIYNCTKDIIYLDKMIEEYQKMILSYEHRIADLESYSHDFEDIVSTSRGDYSESVRRLLPIYFAGFRNIIDRIINAEEVREINYKFSIIYEHASPIENFEDSIKTIVKIYGGECEFLYNNTSELKGVCILFDPKIMDKYAAKYEKLFDGSILREEENVKE